MVKKTLYRQQAAFNDMDAAVASRGPSETSA